MMKGECPQCGKVFWIEHPDLWAYKRNGRYICSWGCLRKHDGKEANGMEKQKTILTEEQKTMAVEMALEGQSPIPYLKELGCKNPYTSWRYIRGWARNVYSAEDCARLPEGFRSQLGERAEKARKAREKAAEETEEEPEIELVYDPSIAEEYKAEHEAKKATERTCRILGQEPLDCAAVFSRILKYGRYWKLKDPLRADFMQLTANDVDITLTANEWIRFSAEILLALEQLGIKEGDPEDYTGNNGPL